MEIRATGITTENAAFLTNDVFQEPVKNHNLNKSAGATSVTFIGTAPSAGSDVNISTLPVVGIIFFGIN